MIVFICLLFNTFCRCFLIVSEIILQNILIVIIFQKYFIRPPYVLFVLIVGVVWGVLVYHNKSLAIDFFLIDLKSSEAIFIYLPPIVFKSAFCLDVHTFLRTLPQIMIISVPSKFRFD